MKVNEEKYILSLLEHLFEGVLDMPGEADLEQQMEILSNRMLIAKKMLGLTNKLANPEEKKKHRSRVLGFINQIRSGIIKIERQLSAQ